MHQTYLLLGTNLGNRQQNLTEAITLLQQQCGPVAKRSPVYETEPWGIAEQPHYLNQVLLLETTLSPHHLLQKILDIEKEMGRQRFKKWDQRLIDIDILFYDNLVVNEKSLQIPHPHLHQRMFALLPLNQIAPDYVHPVLNQPIKKLHKECTDTLTGKIIEINED